MSEFPFDDFKETDFNEFERFFKTNTVNPIYDHRANFQTNSPSFYEYLAKHNHLIKILAKRIYDYDKELAKRFLEWDKRIEHLPDELQRMFLEWVDDGTLARILAQLLLDDYATKEEVNDLVKTLENDLNIKINEKINTEFYQLDKKHDDHNELIKIDYNDKISSLNNKLDTNVSLLRTDFDNYVKSLVGGGVSETLSNYEELISKYPNGKKGIIITSNNGQWWYYDTEWKNGGSYSNSFYKLIGDSGKAINLFSQDWWVENPDCFSLNSGIYSVLVQTEEGDYLPAFPITKNFPENIKHPVRCILFVIDMPQEDRKDFVLRTSSSGYTYTCTLGSNGVSSGWKRVMVTSDIDILQQYKLTLDSGNGLGFDFHLKGKDNVQELTPDLVSPLVDMPTGDYYRTIRSYKDLGYDKEFRNLPPDFWGYGVSFVSVRTSFNNRRVITIINRYANTVWFGNLLKRNDGTVEENWVKLENSEDMFDKQQRDFSARVMINQNDKAIKLMLITDTHIELDSHTAQYSHRVNGTHINNFNKVSRLIDNIDYRVHLGDLIQGYGDHLQSASTLNKITKDFYDVPNSYMIYGNHDTNGGYGSLYQDVKHHVNGYYDQDFLNKFFTKRANIDSDVNYYSVVDNEKNIKLIFLNSFDYKLEGNEEGIVHYNPYSAFGFSKDQVKWLVEELENNDGKDVIFFSHAPLDYVFGDYGTYYNGQVVKRIIEDFNNKKTNQYSPSKIDNTNPQFEWYNAQGEYDFTNNTGNVLCVFSGHQHIDRNIKINGITHVGLLCSKAESGDNPQKPYRDYFTYEEDSFSYVEIDRENKKIIIYRYGAGQDYIIDL